MSEKHRASAMGNPPEETRPSRRRVAHAPPLQATHKNGGQPGRQSGRQTALVAATFRRRGNESRCRQGPGYTPRRAATQPPPRHAALVPEALRQHDLLLRRRLERDATGAVVAAQAGSLRCSSLWSRILHSTRLRGCSSDTNGRRCCSRIYRGETTTLEFKAALPIGFYHPRQCAPNQIAARSTRPSL